MTRPPLVGQLLVTLIRATEVQIHGDRYFDLLVQTDAEAEAGTGSRYRIALHAIDGGLLDGQSPRWTMGTALELTFLMGQVTLVREPSSPTDHPGSDRA